MKNLPFCLSVALLGIVPFVAPATAQKGMGSPAASPGKR